MADDCVYFKIISGCGNKVLCFLVASAVMSFGPLLTLCCYLCYFVLGTDLDFGAGANTPATLVQDKRDLQTYSCFFFFQCEKRDYKSTPVCRVQFMGHFI